MKRKNITWEILSYNIMMIPSVILLVIFSVLPMAGIIMAFQRFVPARGIFGSAWVGLGNFTYMFELEGSMQAFRNTVIIAVLKIIAGIVAPVVFALLLNEAKNKTLKRAVQTIAYLPHFLSWVILAGIFINLFTLDGLVNMVISAFGIEPVMFMGSNFWFRPILIITDTWKNFGYGAIIYLAALTAIDPNLYEAAAIDGAGKWKSILRITLPMLVPTIILMTTLSLGNILNAGFDQIFNMYNTLVYRTADIIDTYVYRIGLVSRQYSLGTAVGLLKSVVSFFLINISYILARKFAGYRIF